MTNVRVTTHRGEIMNKKILIVILAILLPLMISCGKKKVVYKEENQTHIIKVSNYQAVFDLMPMKQHKEMMLVMKSPMKHIKGATHGLMLTLLDFKTKRVIKGATATFTIKNPHGELSKLATEVISGAGMFHYAIHFNGSINGEYNVKADFHIKNKKHNAKTVFSIKE